jgi:hypothetical protein
MYQINMNSECNLWKPNNLGTRFCIRKNQVNKDFLFWGFIESLVYAGFHFIQGSV